MAITVEDGTGLADADSYISVTAADTYVADHGADAVWTAGSVDDKEQALRLATQALDVQYISRWKGIKIGTVQALDWPREGVFDEDGFAVDDDAVPKAVEDACVELAIRQINGEVLVPDVDEPGTIRSKFDKVGPLETRTVYASPRSQVKAFRIVDFLLRDVIFPAGTLRRA